MNFFFRNFKKQYPTAASGQGVWIWDSAGNKYLDASSGAIVANIGHGVERVAEAVHIQMSRISFAHTSQFVSEPGLELSRRLVDIVGVENGSVYFTSGGSEAVESSLKLARTYHLETGGNDRVLCISRRPSYHGSTFGALTVSGHPARRKPYEPLLDSSMKFKDGKPYFINQPYPYRCRCGSHEVCNRIECAKSYAAELEELILEAGPEHVMAFIAEPVVGAAMGALVPHDGYWKEIRSICTKYGVLFIADEVMAGLGRIGEKVALDAWDVKPDIVALGKGLASGYLPLGAVVCTERVADAIRGGSGIFEHGFTYSGHPVSCAAGVAVVDYMQEHKLIERVKAKESDFFSLLSNLKGYDIVGNIRGKGFLAGIEFVADRSTKEPFPANMSVSQMVTREAHAFGLIVYPGSAFLEGGRGDHILVAPPLNITDDELEEMEKRLNKALSSVTQALYSRS